jgi:hypothetical protein
MKYAGFLYQSTSNLGDQIQSIATEQFLPVIDARVDRDYLNEVKLNEIHLIVMQGWFSHFPKRCFPPSESLKPVFFGFHISDWNNSWDHFLKPENLEFLRRHEPIGCRDRKTAEILSENSVNTFYSKCLTLTLPKRDKSPKNGKVFLVSTEGIPIPEHLRKGSVVVSQDVLEVWSEDLKFRMANELLNAYKENARLVITTKIHTAMPCIAMGIPVVFFGNPFDYRVSILNDLCVPINPFFKAKDLNYLPKILSKNLRIAKRIESIIQHRKMKLNMDNINWDPTPVDIEEEKISIIRRFKEMLNSATL